MALKHRKLRFLRKRYFGTVTIRIIINKMFMLSLKLRERNRSGNFSVYVVVVI